MNLDFFKQFQTSVDRNPEQVGLQHITGESREPFTYRRIGEEITRVSCFLKTQGIGPGSTVGILMENHPRWGISFLAAQSAGAKIVPFDTLHDTQTLAALIQHSECNFLVSSEKFGTKLEEIQQRLPQRLPVLMNGGSSGRYFEWDKLPRQGQSLSFPLAPQNLDDPFVIIYTSGTTGNPKGVVLTRRNVYRNTVGLLRLIQVTPEDHILSVLPLFHVLALMTNFIIPLYNGARVTYLDSLDAQRILKTFQDEGVTIFVCVPQFYYLVHRRIFQEIEKQSVVKRSVFHLLLHASHLANERFNRNPGKWFFRPVHERFGKRFRFFGVGGARFDRDVAKSMRDLGFTIVQAYGMTETAAVATVTPFNSSSVDSVGLPLPHVEIRIDSADENGIGEVLIRGENIMQGYWKNPEATAEVMKDGWLNSGDLGYRDDEGHLFITGRRKDVIVLSSGKNIYPEEIEHFYQTNCPYIKEMCIVGLADRTSRQKQERLHAVVVPDFDYMKAQHTANAYDAVRYMLETLSQQLPTYKRVHSFQIRRDPLPRTTTRKIKRFEVEREVAEGTAPETSAPSVPAEETPSAVGERIHRLIQGMKQVGDIRGGMSLELDLGIDSLERVELLSTIQQTFRVPISDERASQIFTVQELVSAVEEGLKGDVQESPETLLSWKEILRAALKPSDQEKVREFLDQRPVSELCFYLLCKFVFLMAKVLFQLRVRGLEHLPHKYPYLICPNHLSFVDPFVVVAPLPRRVIKRLFFLGFADYFQAGILGYLGRLIKVLPVNADMYLRQALRLGAEGLSRNRILCVFPEGERSIDGKLKVFRKGPAILAKEMDVPVVPVAIVGTYEVWPRGVSRFRLHPVSVHFGEPLEPTDDESYEDFNQRLYEAVEKLIDKESSARRHQDR